MSKLSTLLNRTRWTPAAGDMVEVVTFDRGHVTSYADAVVQSVVDGIAHVTDGRTYNTRTRTRQGIPMVNPPARFHSVLRPQP